MTLLERLKEDAPLYLGIGTFILMGVCLVYLLRPVVIVERVEVPAPPTKRVPLEVRPGFRQCPATSWRHIDGSRAWVYSCGGER